MPKSTIGYKQGYDISSTRKGKIVEDTKIIRKTLKLTTVSGLSCLRDVHFGPSLAVSSHWPPWRELYFSRHKTGSNDCTIKVPQMWKNKMYDVGWLFVTRRMSCLHTDHMFHCSLTITCVEM